MLPLLFSPPTLVLPFPSLPTVISHPLHFPCVLFFALPLLPPSPNLCNPCSLHPLLPLSRTPLLPRPKAPRAKQRDALSQPPPPLDARDLVFRRPSSFSSSQTPQVKYHPLNPLFAENVVQRDYKAQEIDFHRSRNYMNRTKRRLERMKRYRL